MHCARTNHVERFSNVDHNMNRHFCNHGNALFTNLGTSYISSNGFFPNISTEKPKYSKFAIKSVRISSFRTFPGNHTQTATQLAEAGFFYSGKDDVVYCFFCGQGLRSWDSEDEPWIEHAKWSPQCQYIKDVKGIEFIYKVQEAQSDPDLMDVLVQSLRGVRNQVRKPMVTTYGSSTNQGDRIPTDFLMETVAAQSVMKTGYSRAIVAKAVDIYLKQNGSTDFKGENLMNIILDLEDGLIKYEEIITSCDRVKISENFDVHNIGSLNEDQPDMEIDGETTLDLDFLKNENTKLKERTICRQCKVETVSIVFLPCGHLCCCSNCAPDLDHCPKCKQFIKATVKTFLT